MILKVDLFATASVDIALSTSYPMNQTTKDVGIYARKNAEVFP
jgi:hypothetical protein